MKNWLKKAGTIVTAFALLGNLCALPVQAQDVASEMCVNHTLHNEECGFEQDEVCTHECSECITEEPAAANGDVEPDAGQEEDGANDEQANDEEVEEVEPERNEEQAEPNSLDLLPETASEITGFETLDENIALQNFEINPDANDIQVVLPETIDVTIGEDNTEYTTENVVWECTGQQNADGEEVAVPEFNPAQAGVYLFTPALPEGMALAPAVAAPTITVMLEQPGMARAASSWVEIDMAAVTGSKLLVNITSATEYEYSVDNGANYTTKKIADDGLLLIAKSATAINKGVVIDGGGIQDLEHPLEIKLGDASWGLELDVTTGAAIDLQNNAWVRLYGDDDESKVITLKSSGAPGIHVPEGCQFDFAGGNIKEIAAGGFCAGIGSDQNENAGVINLTDPNGTERSIISIKGGAGGAGIGGGVGSSGGTINISGMDIKNIIGGENAAGIGTGKDGTTAVITISGGTTIKNAEGSKDGGGAETGGAGIGGGHGAAGCDITITGRSSIKAKSTGYGAGIGNGSSATNKGKIVIEDSAVIESAQGGEYAAGIGGGYENSCDIDFQDRAKVKDATGGAYAAGIGSGYLSYKSADSATINFNTMGEIHAQGGAGGAGVGTGHSGKNDTITIEYIDLFATGGSTAGNTAGGAGLGSGYVGDACDITISGGKISEAIGGVGSAGIGAGGFANGGSFTSGSDLKITFSGYVVIENAQGGAATGTNGSGGAGIGCGENGYENCYIDIAGGFVNATGNGSAQDIGKGSVHPSSSKSVMELSITGGSVVPTRLNNTNYANLTDYIAVDAADGPFPVAVPKTTDKGESLDNLIVTISAQNGLAKSYVAITGNQAKQHGEYEYGALLWLPAGKYSKVLVGQSPNGMIDVQNRWPNSSGDTPENTLYFIDTESILLEADAITMYVGETINLTSTVTPSDIDSDIKWELNEQVGTATLTIDDDADTTKTTLKATQYGKVTVQAFATDGTGVASNLIEIEIKSTPREGAQAKHDEITKLITENPNAFEAEGLDEMQQALESAKKILDLATDLEENYAQALEILNEAYSKLRIIIDADVDTQKVNVNDKVVLTPRLDGTDKAHDAWSYNGVQVTWTVNSPATITFLEVGEVTITFTDTTGIIGTRTYIVTSDNSSSSSDSSSSDSSSSDSSSSSSSSSIDNGSSKTTSKSPQTGDANNLILWVFFAVLSIGCAFAIIVVYKINKKQKADGE